MLFMNILLVSARILLWGQRKIIRLEQEKGEALGGERKRGKSVILKRMRFLLRVLKTR